MMQSSHILISLPLPGIQYALSLIKGASLWQSLIRWEPVVGREVSRHLFLFPLKYFLYRALCAQSGCGPMILQKILAPMAMFWRLRSLKLRPPSI